MIRPYGQRLLAALLLLILVIGAQAQDLSGNGAAEPAAEETGRAAVRVEGRKIFDIGPTEDESAAERAARINRRLENLIARGETVRPFTKQDILSRKNETVITLGGESILSVTNDDAAEQLSTREEVAMLWGGKLAIAVADARSARDNPLRGAGILIRNSFQDLLVGLVRWLPRLGGALVLWLLFWLLARGVRWIVSSAVERTHLDANLRQLARAVAFYGTWVVGIIAILSTLGLEGGSIATGLGISGFVLGFAFKDILSHFFAGLLLLMGRQFGIGDQIRVKEFEGTVEHIELRALYLRTFDNRLVIIPNGDVFTSAVISNTAYDARRRDFVVGISYDADIEQAQHLGVETLKQIEGVLEEPPPFALVEELAASTVNLRFYFYTSPRRADYLKVGSKGIRAVKQAFNREEIAIPFEVQTIRIENLGEVADELERIVTTPARRHAEERREENDRCAPQPRPAN